MEVRRSDAVETPVRKSDLTRDAGERVAAEMFSQALKASGINRDEAAALMGVSRSLVDKFCEATGKSPSLIQVVLLGPAFHIELIKELDKHFGLGRALLARVQQSLGTLGLMVR